MIDISERFYHPRGPKPDRKVDERKERFDEMNRYVTERLGWLTSVPGAAEVTMECLPDSTLPDDLRKRGYVLNELPPGERILHSRIVERFFDRADGARIAVTAGSTLPVTSRIEHAGICPTRRFSFDLL